MKGKPSRRDRKGAIEKKLGLLETRIQRLIDAIADGQRSLISRHKNRFVVNGVRAETGKAVNEMVGRIGVEPVAR